MGPVIYYKNYEVYRINNEIDDKSILKKVEDNIDKTIENIHKKEIDYSHLNDSVNSLKKQIENFDKEALNNPSSLNLKKGND